MPIRVLLADDHLVCQGLKALLEQVGFDIVGHVSNGQEAVQLAGERGPDVAVLDFAMPFLNGLDAARELVKVAPRTRAILLTMHMDDRYVLEALQAAPRPPRPTAAGSWRNSRSTTPPASSAIERLVPHSPAGEPEHRASGK